MTGQGKLTQAGYAEVFPRVGRNPLKKGTQDTGTWKSYRGGDEGEEE